MPALELVPRLALFTCTITCSNARLRMQALEVVKLQVKNASIGTSSKTGILSCIITIIMGLHCIWNYLSF